VTRSPDEFAVLEILQKQIGWAGTPELRHGKPRRKKRNRKPCSTSREQEGVAEQSIRKNCLQREIPADDG